MNIIRTITRFLAAALVMTAAFGCDKNRHNTEEPESADRRVLLFYECAFNDIGSYMQTNMEDQNTGLPAGYIPGKYGDVLLVYSRISKGKYDYTPVNSYLRRIYKTSKGKVISDTLKVFGKETIAASPSTLSAVLTLVREKFPANKGTGWCSPRTVRAGFPPATLTARTNSRMILKERVEPQGIALPLKALDIQGFLSRKEIWPTLIRSTG